MSINQNFGRRHPKKESVELEMKIKNILLRSKKNPKKRKSKSKTLNKISCKWNSKLKLEKNLLLLLLKTMLSLERTRRKRKEHEIKNRMSENQKTILNIKKTKAKNQNNLFCNWQTYTKHTNRNTYMYGTRNYILYCIVFGILLFEQKQKRKETLLLCKTMCENNLKVIIYIYIYTIYVMSRAKSKAVEITATDLYPPSHPPPLHFTCHQT